MSDFIKKKRACRRDNNGLLLNFARSINLATMLEECFGEGPFIFRINDNGTGPQLLTQVCLERGWKEFNASNGDQWNLWWKTSGFPINHHRSLYGWQYINHIPKSSSICRKDNLARYLKCMRKIYGSIYDFSPVGYNLPLEYTKLAAECNRSRSLSLKENHCDDKPVWICKPVSQSQGRGIFLFRKLSELTYDTNTIVQRYIERPLLIGGYKFDLRLYVCIPSYYPLTIYLYREGLARFGTDKFTLNDLRNPFRHLTNSSINKLGPGYGEMKERIGSGCKWTLRRLRRYFSQTGISDWLLWQRISVLITLTVLSHASQVPPTVNCFEFFGFDVLIDYALRPWLLEVNLGPALGNDCDADTLVKKPMLHDMFDLLGFPLYNTGLSVFHILAGDAHESEDENVKPPDISTKSTVLNAAAKWRKKQKHNRTFSANRKKSRISSASTVTLPKLQPTSPSSYALNQKPNINDDLDPSRPFNDDYNKRCNNSRRWGNSKDWKAAPSSEGGWIRIWPMNSLNSEINTKNVAKGSIKHMVTQVMKFSKTAKELVKKHPNVSDCQLNEFLAQEMEMTSELWSPPK